jgi:hypothetical protein
MCAHIEISGEIRTLKDSLEITLRRYKVSYLTYTFALYLKKCTFTLARNLNGSLKKENIYIMMARKTFISNCHTYCIDDGMYTHKNREMISPEKVSFIFCSARKIKATIFMHSVKCIRRK